VQDEQLLVWVTRVEVLLLWESPMTAPFSISRFVCGARCASVISSTWVCRQWAAF